MNQKEPADLTGEELESAKEENEVVVADFWAEWCSPCKQMEPIMDSLAEEYGDKAFFAKINVDKEREAASTYQVSSIPSLLFFKDGELVDRTVGAFPQKELGEKIEEIVQK
ncbi:hypothetical protein AKJ50_00025 [candidate division MSBL1 archaeon SCGC-AAA382A13]|uniref:Thioredoxin domain-containing protein n=1 Tax=candidate division MSBL1 archaeon SCGC-AAA382A13 TaxID=1698279 RepID=A0A133VH28_9EURY|nr:hypothetical protein AKJ50_00025 [candidate division MSBL1 archaeon SCGC-AAA382A13]